MAGFRTFATGEVLTAANVDDFLMKQSVQKYADAAARDAALGTAVAGGNALREGMVAYLDSTDELLKYDGASWSAIGGGAFDAADFITVTDPSWPVPSLGSPIVKVTVIGGGAGGGSNTAGGSSTFDAGAAGSVSAAGGPTGTPTAVQGLVSGNGGRGAMGGTSNLASGYGGTIAIGYLDLTGVTSANVTVGAGGTGNTSTGGAGAVIVEYKVA